MRHPSGPVHRLALTILNHLVIILFSCVIDTTVKINFASKIYKNGDAMFTYYVSFQGHNTKDVSSRTYVLKAPDYATAQTELLAIKSELVDATDSFIRSERLTEALADDNQLPAIGINTYECAVVICHLNAPAEAEKLHTVYIPAPPAAFFLDDGTTLDTSNSDLQDYIGVLAANTFVSDGEEINTASGTAGIKSGYRLVKARNFKA